MERQEALEFLAHTLVLSTKLQLGIAIVPPSEKDLTEKFPAAMRAMGETEVAERVEAEIAKNKGA